MTVRVLMQAPAPLVAVCPQCGSLLAFDPDDVSVGYAWRGSGTSVSIQCPVCRETDGDPMVTISVEYADGSHGDDERHYLGEIPSDVLRGNR